MVFFVEIALWDSSEMLDLSLTYPPVHFPSFVRMKTSSRLQTEAVNVAGLSTFCLSASLSCRRLTACVVSQHPPSGPIFFLECLFQLLYTMFFCKLILRQLLFLLTGLPIIQFLPYPVFL